MLIPTVLFILWATHSGEGLLSYYLLMIVISSHLKEEKLLSMFKSNATFNCLIQPIAESNHSYVIA